uniref:Uncharacterized protein n=1 Tax=Zea mays TaxID=4577 RepID=A0A804QLA5_MAIZE
MAVTSLMMFVESLQVNIKAAMKLDEGSCSRLTTLTETILDAVINKSLLNLFELLHLGTQSLLNKSLTLLLLPIVN